MKRIAVVFFALMVVTGAYAQKKVAVTERSEMIGAGGSHNALVTTIYEVKQSDVEKEWKSYIKDLNAKVTSFEKQILGDNATMKEMGTNTFDIYARTVDNKDGSITLIVGFDLGGAYLSSSQHPEQFKAAKKLVHNFAVKVSKQAVEEQVKEQEKIQKKLEKEQEELVKAKTDLEKDIEEYKNKIKKAEADIQTNLKQQEAKKGEVEAQKKVVTATQAKLKAIE